MNMYQALVILKPVVDMDYADSVLKNLEEAIQNMSGKIVKVEKMGRKRLAYPIAKFKDGLVAAIYFESPTAGMAKFVKDQQINEDILRMMVTRETVFSKEEVVAGATRPSRPPQRRRA